MDAEQLGQQLRAAREARELTLREVEQATRIRVKYLTAFEAGRYDDLPSGPQARGFLSNYARLLRLNEEAALASFDVALAKARRRARLSLRRRRLDRAAQVIKVDESELSNNLVLEEFDSGPGIGRHLLRLLLFAAASFAVIGLCGLTVLFAERLIRQQAEAPGVSLVQVLPTRATATPSHTFQPSPTLLPGQEVFVVRPVITDRVVLTVSVVQRTWMQVTVDGEVIFQGIAEPDQQLTYEGVALINLRTSNAAALDVDFNNINVGVLGARGELVDRDFSPDMALTPTIAPTATATLTPEAPQEALPGLPPPVAVTEDVGAGAAGTTPAATDALLPEQVTSTPLPPVGGATTAAPAAGETSEVTATGQPSTTPTPTNTPTPGPTLTPSPTAILPPRFTSTPAQEKQG